MFSLNKNQKRRDALLKIKEPRKGWPGGLEYFGWIELGTLEKLVKDNFICLEDGESVGPSHRQTLNFLREHPEFKVSGYAVSSSRHDYRITLQRMLFVGAVKPKMKKDFKNLCMHDGCTGYEATKSCLWANFHVD